MQSTPKLNVRFYLTWQWNRAPVKYVGRQTCTQWYDIRMNMPFIIHSEVNCSERDLIVRCIGVEGIAID